MGEIHQQTKNFVPSDQKCKRDEFQGDFALADAYKLHPDVKETADELIQEIMQFFDFDDCLYSWFAMDIGIALYHGLWWGRPSTSEAAQEFSKEFIKNFLKGYAAKNHLDLFWITKLPLFMRYRQLCKFSWFFNPNDINEE